LSDRLLELITRLTDALSVLRSVNSGIFAAPIDNSHIKALRAVKGAIDEAHDAYFPAFGSLWVSDLSSEEVVPRAYMEDVVYQGSVLLEILEAMKYDDAKPWPGLHDLTLLRLAQLIVGEHDLTPERSVDELATFFRDIGLYFDEQPTSVTEVHAVLRHLSSTPILRKVLERALEPRQFLLNRLPVAPAAEDLVQFLRCDGYDLQLEGAEYRLRVLGSSQDHISDTPDAPEPSQPETVVPDASESSLLPAAANRVFIVHGHDEEMKQSVARAIEKFGLEAVVLHERPNGGATLLEKLEREASQAVGFCVALLSPDDLGRAKAASQEDERARARQNVVLELGYFMGLLGRSHVLALYRGSDEFERPSDIDGLVYVQYDANGGWRLDLARELRAAGLVVDIAALGL